MRLINVYSMEMRQFVAKIPRYAILSHRWSEDEISLKEYKNPQKYSRLDSVGYKKVKRFCGFIRDSWRTLLRQDDTLETKNAEPPQPVEWVWIDTVCIDTKSSAELSEAINSMYDWYYNASICVAYLSDVPSITYASTKLTRAYDNLKSSQWFSRGWTLQELLAPKIVVFVNCAWRELGRKDEALALRSSNVLHQDFLDIIAQITNIPRVYIGLRDRISGACFAEKMSWASKRSTSRQEDMAYCLLGLLNVNMPLLYGEGAQKAFLRLQQQFIQQSDDESIFAWNNAAVSLVSPLGILASSPSDFRDSGRFRAILPTEEGYTARPPYAITNKGLSFETPVYNVRREHYDDNPKPHIPWIPRIFIDRELPPGQIYAVPLNCRTTLNTVRHDGRVLCNLTNRGALSGSFGRNSRIAYIGETCFIFLREHEAGMAVGETSDYFDDPDSSLVLGFVGDKERNQKRLFVKLQSAASRVVASDVSESGAKSQKAKMAYDDFIEAYDRGRRVDDIEMAV